MNTKGTILLLVVALAVLGAIYYQNQKEEQTFTAAAIPVQTIPAITSGTVERITIDAPDQEAVTLTKSGDNWYTNIEQKHEADPSAVQAVTGALKEPITATVVSSNPDSYAEYQVTDTSSTKVQVYEKGGAKPALDLLVGKNGPTAFTTYVRMAGAKDVLNAQANLAMTFQREDGWRDRQIFDFSSANATRIEETGTSATFSVMKNKEDKWMFQTPQTGEADSARMSSLINMLASLQAEKFVETTSSQSLANFGLEPPRQTVALTYEDKTTSPSTSTSVTLLIGNKAPAAPQSAAEAGNGADTDGGWYAKRADKDEIFTIGIHAAEALTPDPESFNVTPPAPAQTAEETTQNTATTEETAATTETEAITTDTVTHETEADSRQTTESVPMAESTIGTTPTL